MFGIWPVMGPATNSGLYRIDRIPDATKNTFGNAYAAGAIKRDSVEATERVERGFGARDR